MAIPTWTVGEVLASADVNSWFVPLAAYKGSDQSVTSSTTLVNDTALVVAVAANATYRMECYLDYEGGTQGSADLKWGWTFPAGLTMDTDGLYLGTSGAVTTGTQRNQAAVQAAGTNGAGNRRTIQQRGSVLVSSTAGSLQLQWAQNTSNGTATIVHAGSYLMLTRIG